MNAGVLEEGLQQRIIGGYGPAAVVHKNGFHPVRQLRKEGFYAVNKEPVGVLEGDQNVTGSHGVFIYPSGGGLPRRPENEYMEFWRFLLIFKNNTLSVRWRCRGGHHARLARR